MRIVYAHVEALEKMAARKRNELSLKKKVEVIEYARKNPNVGSGKLASLFECGKTQIQTILRKRGDIMADFEKNSDGGRKISVLLITKM